MITPSAQLTLTKGNKSGSSTAVAAALELVDPLGSGPLAVTHCGRFFFFFFFFFFFLPFSLLIPILIPKQQHFSLGLYPGLENTLRHRAQLRIPRVLSCPLCSSHGA
eukprot:FR735591.1.p3 GENE.FR735591.1~~FR735591.1.p3  ORF type:complete len:107 (-),score=33.39 FR735591.1:482-802(-)